MQFKIHNFRRLVNGTGSPISEGTDIVNIASIGTTQLEEGQDGKGNFGDIILCTFVDENSNVHPDAFILNVNQFGYLTYYLNTLSPDRVNMLEIY